MKPVFQEIIDPNKGDCFSACLASILECNLADIPKFAQRDGDLSKVNDWLTERGLAMVSFKLPLRRNFAFGVMTSKTYAIAGYKSPTFKNSVHAVVVEIERGGSRITVAHDPNPNTKQVTGYPFIVYVLTVADIGKYQFVRPQCTGKSSKRLLNEYGLY